MKELTVDSVLILAVLLLEVLHAIHVVHSRVELLLFGFTFLLNTVDLSIETVQSLFVDLSNRGIRVGSFVHTVIVDGEGTLRTHEFRNRCVVVVRNFLAIQGQLNIGKFIQNSGRSCFSMRADIIVLQHVNFHARVCQSVALNLECLSKKLLVYRPLELRSAEFGQTNGSSMHGCCQGI